jgi:hypothetical protein
MSVSQMLRDAIDDYCQPTGDTSPAAHARKLLGE